MPTTRLIGAALAVVATTVLASAAPATASVSPKQAADRAVAALKLNGSERPVIVFKLGVQRSGTVLAQAGSAAAPSAGSVKGKLGVASAPVRTALTVRQGRRAHAFYADLAPHQAYTHEGRFVLVDAASGATRVSRTVHGAPLVAGRQPAFQRSSAAYNSSRRQVLSTPYAAASATVEQQVLGYRIDRAPTADLALAKRIADRLAAEHACSLRVSDTFGEFFDFTGADRTRAELGDMFFTLSRLNPGFTDRRYSRTSKRSPVADLRRMITGSGCQSVLLYIAGQGFSKGPGTTVAIGTRVRPGRVLQQLVHAQDVRKLIAAHRGVGFSVMVDAPHTRGFVDLLAKEPNVILATSAAGADGASFGYLPAVRTGKTTTDNAGNPDQALEFTNRLLAGATRFLTSATEIAQPDGRSLLATMFGRAFVLGAAHDLTHLAGLSSPHFAPTAAMPQPPAGPAAPPTTPVQPTTPAPPVTPEPPAPAPNNPPLASSASVSTDEDTPVAVTLGAVDPDGDPLSFEISVAPQHGTLAGTGASRTYSPARDFNGSDSFEFTVTDGRGGSASAFVTIQVRAVNDPPVLTLPAGPLTIGKGDGPGAVADGADIIDVDSAQLERLTISITAGRQPADVLAAPPSPGLTRTFDAVAGTLTLSGTATVTTYRSALRSVTFSVGTGPVSGARTISVVAFDGVSDSAPVERTINVVNDPPAVTFPTSTAAHTEGGAPTQLPGDAVVSDTDDATLQGLEVAVTVPEAGDLLGYTPADGITGSWHAPTATLTLSGSATVAQYTAALRRVTYETTSLNPSPVRTIRARANDGETDGPWSDVTVNVTAVNDAPVVTTSGGTVTFTEGDAPLAVDPGLTIADPDSAQLQGASVQLSGGLATGDLLAATTQGGVTPTYNAGTGTLTLTGNANLATYEAILRSVTFHTARTDLPDGTRTVTFTVTDAAGDPSSPATRTLRYVDENAPPSVSITGTGSFTEGGSAAAVLSTATITDADSTQMSALSAQITTGLFGSDLLTITAPAGVVAGYEPLTGTLTMIGLATTSAYETAIASIRFSNPRTDLPSGSRVLAITVTDERGSMSLPATAAVNVTSVNNAPVMTLTSGSITYTEDDPAIVVDAALTVSDPDGSSGPTTSAAVTTATGTLGLLAGYTLPTGITVTGAGTATLAFSGTSTPAAYQDALRAVTYRGPTEIIGTGTDWVDFEVVDQQEMSTPVRRGVNLIGVNDAPVANDDTFTTGEKSTHVAALTGNDSDPDNTTAELTIDRINGTAVAVGDTVTLPSGATATLTTAGTVTYDPNGRFDALGIGDPDGTDGFTYRASDPDGASSNTATVTAAITPVNDAPTASNRSFRGVSNVGLRLGGSALADPHVTASGALLTDGAADVDGPAPTSVVPATVATTGGGSAVIAADGSFVYRSATGANPADDTFTYEVQDAHGATGSATVTITLVERVWFVDNNRAGSTGRSDSPLQTVSAAVAAAGTTDKIFVAGGGSAYGPAGTLKTGQQLLGATTWDVNVGTSTAPVMTTIHTSGTRAVIAASSGYGADLATGTRVQGINFASSAAGGGISATSATTTQLVDVAIGLGEVSGTGSSLFVSGGSITLTNVDVDNRANATTAVLLTNANATAGNGSTITATGQGLVTTGGATHTGALDFDSINAGRGISIGTGHSLTVGAGLLRAALDETALSVTAGSAAITVGAEIQAAHGRAVNVTGRTGGTITLPGQISKTGLGTAISTSANTGSTVRFTGSPITLSSSSAQLVDLGIGAGSRVEFTAGNLTLTGTSSAAGLRATGPGTLAISGATNSITTQSGAAVSLSGIASAGITLRSVSSNGAPNGITAEAVTLTGGANTALEVTGDGTESRNGSGGTIASSQGSDGAAQGNGVRLSNTAAIKLRQMSINASANHGVWASGVDGLDLTQTTVSANGTASGGPYYEGNVRLQNLTGSTTIANNLLQNPQSDNVYLTQSSGSAAVTIQANELSIDPARAGEQNDQILVDAATTATSTLTLSIADNDFGTKAAGDAIQIAPASAAAADWRVSLINNTAHSAVGGEHAEDLGGGFTINPTEFDGAFRYRIEDNSVRGVQTGPAINVSPGTGSGNLDGLVNNNTIGVNGQVSSGSAQGAGLAVETRGTGTHTTAITNNNIYGYGPFGLDMNVGGTGSNPVLNATVTGNTIATPKLTEPSITRYGMHFNVGVNTISTTSCIDVRGNSIAGSGGPGDPAVDPDLRMRQRNGSTVRLPGYGGAAADTNAISAFLVAANDDIGTPSVTSSTNSPNGTFAGGAPCAQPNAG